MFAMLYFLLVLMYVMCRVDWPFMITFASKDLKSGIDEIFAVHPETGRIINITRGRVRKDGGYSQPWEPVGTKNKVVFRQWLSNMNTRVFVAEYTFLPSENCFGWRLDQMKDESRYIVWFAWSPKDNDKFAVIERSTNGNFIDLVKDLEIYKRIPLPGQYAKILKWSKDGRMIAVSTNVGIFLTDLDGSSTKVFSAHSLGDFAISPDCSSVAFSEDKTIKIVGIHGGSNRTYESDADRVHDWSKDGKFISFRGYTSNTVEILDLETGSTKKIDAPGENFGGGWSPSGKSMTFWHDIGNYSATVGVVGKDGEGYKGDLGRSSPAGCMPLSWISFPWFDDDDDSVRSEMEI